MKLFIDAADMVSTTTYVNTAGKFPKAIPKPNKDFILDNVIFGVTKEERQKVYDKLFAEYELKIKAENVFKLECTWQYWSYLLRSQINKESRKVDQIQGESYDTELLNDNKIKYLLKDWNIVDDAGAAVPLIKEDVILTLGTITTVSRLNEESFKKVRALEPSIIQSFLNDLDTKLYLGETEEKN